jgi:MoxR-like ATPase
VRNLNAEIKKLTKEAEKHSKELNKVIDEAHKIIVGQEDVVERLVMALIADGHILLEGVPGLAKTLMIRTLSDTLHAKFCRIQFTPDLLPADIIGTKIYDHKKSSFYTKKGPIFSNFVLADEINRAPPKVQSALLEAMQEKQVTIQGETYPLARPFLVMATQNPIETEGTYKLPEAQVDRFMFKLLIAYPEVGHEKEIIQRMTKGIEYSVKKVLSPEQIKKVQRFCTKVYADEKIESYVANLVDSTRNPKKYGLDIDGHIEYGASPRASIWLVLAGKAHALMNGRGYVTPEDVQAVAHDVLRHRILLSYEAEADEVTAEQIIDKVLAKVKVP